MKTLFKIFFCFILTLTSVASLEAQCPMCKANVESTLKGDGRKTGLGLNDGIIFLLALPYTAVGVVGFLWYRSNQKKRRANAQA